MSCADRATHQPGTNPYRVTVQETQRREITLYARSPADAVDNAMEHSVGEARSVLNEIRCGPATVTVESVTRLSLNGPTSAGAT